MTYQENQRIFFRMSTGEWRPGRVRTGRRPPKDLLLALRTLDPSLVVCISTKEGTIWKPLHDVRTVRHRVSDCLLA